MAQVGTFAINELHVMPCHGRLYCHDCIIILQYHKINYSNAVPERTLHIIWVFHCACWWPGGQWHRRADCTRHLRIVFYSYTTGHEYRREINRYPTSKISLFTWLRHNCLGIVTSAAEHKPNDWDTETMCEVCRFNRHLWIRYVV